MRSSIRATARTRRSAPSGSAIPTCESVNLDPEPELIALRTALEGNPPATLEAIRETERQIDFEFPPDLVEFFTLCDGGEGWWGEDYLRIFALEDIRFHNTAPYLQQYFSDIVVFGGDGGSDWHAFLRGQRWTIVQREPIAGPEYDRIRGRSLLEFIRDLKAHPRVPPTEPRR
ncbi:MAG: SMI1/KNR4 family protein [Chloroflexi bacterium]|nr:MAG: SMI1/KNR4 family protein [Chloroflexota bacterium]